MPHSVYVLIHFDPNNLLDVSMMSNAQPPMDGFWIAASSQVNMKSIRCRAVFFHFRRLPSRLLAVSCCSALRFTG